MAKFIFYTNQEFDIRPNNESVEKFQILGFEEGVSEAEATKNLFKNNVWILEKNYLSENINCKLLFEINFLSKLETIIDYLWEDEEKHYYESMDSDSFAENHIYNTLKEIKELL